MSFNQVNSIYGEAEIYTDWYEGPYWLYDYMEFKLWDVIIIVLSSTWDEVDNVDLILYIPVHWVGVKNGYQGLGLGSYKV